MNMQDKTQNNWKILLENPDSFHGEIIKHKTEAWEKLYQRLHKKPQRKLSAWYWAAASLVVAIGTVMLFISREKNQVTVVSGPAVVKTQSPRVNSKSLTLIQKNRVVKLTKSKQKTRTTAVQKNNLTGSAHFNKNFNPDSVITQLTELVTSPTIINDSSAIHSVTVTIPAKKKLRVVHLNEIGQPAEESTVNNKFRERHGFGLRVSSGEIYNPVYGSSTNNGLILTKRSNSN